MRLKNLICSILLFSTLSCTDEPDQHNFSVSIKNDSDSVIEIKCFSEKTLQIQKNLNPGESSKICDYTSESFFGLSGCEKDSLVIEFSNSRGYIDKRIGNNQNEYRFSDDKSIFIQGIGFKNSGNDYEFIITQEDFDNAFDLP